MSFEMRKMILIGIVCLVTTCAAQNFVPVENVGNGVDIVFIVDGSSHTEETLFRKELLLIPSIVNNLPIAKENIRFALVTYSSFANLQIEFGSILDNNALLEKLWHIHQHPRQKSGLCYALKLTRTHLFGTKSCCHKKFLVIFTNGEWNLHSITRREALYLRNMGVQILLLVVGHTINRHSIRELTSPSNIVYRPHTVFNYYTNKLIFNFIVQNINKGAGSLPTTILPKPRTTTSTLSKTSTFSILSTVSATLNPENFVSTLNLSRQDSITNSPTLGSNTKILIKQSSTQHPIISNLVTGSSQLNPSIPDLTTESSSKQQIIPDLTTESSSKHQIIPDLTPESSSKHQIIPDLTTESSSKHQIIPDLTTESSSKHPIIPDLTTESSSKYQIIPNLTTESSILRPNTSTTITESVTQLTSTISTAGKFLITSTTSTKNSKLECNSADQLVFIIDSSDNVGPERFIIQIYSVLEFLNTIVLNQTRQEIAIITFGEKAKIRMSFEEYRNATNVCQLVATIKYDGGKTGLGSALSLANQSLFQNQLNPLKRRTVVIFVDGVSDNGPDPVVISSVMKQSYHVKFIVISIGKKNSKWMNSQIASGDDLLISIPVMEDLGLFQSEIVDKICKN